MKLDILETELLPSDVVKVKFYRPPNMKVLSGQWIRFSCTGIPPLTRNSTNAVFTYAIFFLFSNWTRRVSFFYTNLGPTRRLFIGPHQVHRSFHLETSKLVSCFYFYLSDLMFRVSSDFFTFCTKKCSETGVQISAGTEVTFWFKIKTISKFSFSTKLNKNRDVHYVLSSNYVRIQSLYYSDLAFLCTYFVLMSFLFFFHDE